MSQIIRVLAEDPSLCAFGYAVIDCHENRTLSIVELGCLRTTSRPVKTPRKVRTTKAHGKVVTPAKDRPPAGVWESSRLVSILDGLTDVCQRLEPDQAVFEDPCGSQSASASRALGLAKGLCLGHLRTAGIPWQSVSPRASKLRATGDPAAKKPQMLEAIRTKFPDFDEKSRHMISDVERFAAADACAAAYSYLG